jgi:sugar diacid utilization regulator
VTAGLIPADEGSDRLTVDRLALIERWAENFGLDLDYPIEAALAQQEAEHVAQLVDAALDEQRGRHKTDLAVLAAVGRVYLDALDDDPSNEYLTLTEALRVTEVREAVERWGRQ